MLLQGDPSFKKTLIRLLNHKSVHEPPFPSLPALIIRLLRVWSKVLKLVFFKRVLCSCHVLVLLY